MIYNVYWVDNQYPFTVRVSEENTLEDTASGYGNAVRIGKSSVKAEILSRKKIITYINENNDYNGGKIFTPYYISTIIMEIEQLEELFPEETI
jgi:hypothetical protein